MKRFLTLLLAGLLLCGLLLLALPFALIQFGSPGMAAASRALLHAAVGYSDAPSTENLPVLQLAPGYQLQVYAADLGNVRFMAMTAGDDLLISRPRSGEVLLLSRDGNGDGRADEQRVLLSELRRPHGLALHDGWLYVAESNAVGKIAFDELSGMTRGRYQRIVEGLGDAGNHWTKTIGFGPDGWLYLSSGSTCNACEEADPQRATLMRLRGDGSGLEIVARGLRNSVGFDWAPWDGALYATDNGRDLLGDDFPPCELNRIEAGEFYGWPYFNARRPDPDWGARRPSALPDNRPPVHEFGAHQAPLGMTFLRHQGEGYRKAALVALHGSWNRSEPAGYKVVSLLWQADGSIVERDFVSGFLQSRQLLGRPVDVLESRDGSIFVSDDYSGRVYRISRGAGGAAEVLRPAVAGGGKPADSHYPVGRLAELSALGQSLYGQHGCDSCHRQQGMRPLTNLTARYSVAELADFFVSPTPPMPQFELSAGQREALAVYLLNVVDQPSASLE